MRVLKSKYITFSFLSILVSYFIACGISDIPSFAGATVSLVVPGVFRVSHNTNNATDAFVGYQLYYKFYSSANTTTISTDKDYITDTIRSASPGTITGKGFRELIPVSYSGTTYSKLDRNPILKPSNKNVAKEYYIDFTSGTQQYGLNTPRSSFIAGFDENQGYQALLIEDTGATTIVHRQLNNNETKSFFDKKSSASYAATDADISGMLGASYKHGDQFQVVIAVIPYGIDFQAAQRVYGNIAVSVGTLLGYTTTP